MRQYAEILKEDYKSHKKYTSDSKWPPFTPKKFTELGFVIHKPRRTQKETEDFAESKWSGSFSSAPKHTCENFGKSSDYTFDSDVVIKDNISDIFLSAENGMQIILVEGAPGIGKTMLIKEIAHLWATGELLTDTEIILLLSLRNPKIDTIDSPKDMFYHHCRDEEKAKIYASYFYNNKGSGLVILLDGLDENQKVMKHGRFLYKLVSEGFYSKACIIITSRPHATIDLQMHVDYRVEIIGFTMQRRHEFVHDNLEQKDGAELENYLKNHSVIDTLCHIPLNLSILLFLFKEKPRVGSSFALPKTQTELIKSAVEMTVSHNLQKLGQTGFENDLRCLPEHYKYIFLKFCRLAYEALAKIKLTFTRSEIKAACSVEDVCKHCNIPLQNKFKINDAIQSGLGLIQTAEFHVDMQGDTDRLSNFVHFSVQEMLAAWDISFWHKSLFQYENWFWCFRRPLDIARDCMYFYVQQRELEDKFWKGEYINMWTLYIGLTKGKDKVFKHFLSGNYLVQRCCKKFSISQKILDKKVNVLLLYMCLQEAPGNELIEHLQMVIGKNCLDLNKEQLTEEDINLLGYILSRPYLTSQWKTVSLSSCNIDDNKFVVLHSKLTRDDGILKPEIQALSLCNNKLMSCSTAVASMAQNQKIISLNLSGNALKNLCDFKLCVFLETLDISNNDLTNKEALELFPALEPLKKLKELKLRNNHIGDDEDVVDAICLALCCCDSLENLELEGNMIKDKATVAFDIITRIRNSASEEFSFSMSIEAIVFIRILHCCSKVTNKRNRFEGKIANLAVLNISCCSLQDCDAQTLGTCLYMFESLKKLDISENRLSDASSKALTKGLLLTPQLNQFQYDASSFTKQSIDAFKIILYLRDTSSRVLKCLPSETRALIFLLKCISELDKDVLWSNDIVRTLGCVTELDLRYEGNGVKLNDDNVGSLCPLLGWFKQLEILHMNDNDISAEATEPIILSVLQIHTFKQVVVTGNPIIDSEISMTIFTIVKELHKRKLLSIACYQNSNHVRCQSICFIMECLSKIENVQDCVLLHNVVDLAVRSSECVASHKLVDYINFLPSLQCLDLSGATITECGIIKLSTYLITKHNLRRLNLSNNNLKNLRINASQSASKTPLKILRLNNCSITDEVFYDVMHSLVLFSVVDLIELEGNCIGNIGIDQFCRLIANDNGVGRRSTTITSLNLSNNNLDSLCAKHIMKIVQVCNIKALDITKNKLSDASTRELTKGILLAPELKFKYDESLFNNQSINVFKIVRQLRGMTKTVFKCAVLKFNALIFILECIGELDKEYVSSNDIVKTLSCFTKLDLSVRILDESQDKLNDENIRILCPLLKWFRQLKVLCLNNNNIGVEATEPLVQSMLELHAFKEIQVAGNLIADSTLSMCIFSTIKDFYDNKLQSVICESYEKFDHINCHSLLFIMKCLSKLDNVQNCELLNNIVDLVVHSSKCVYSHSFVDYINFLPSLQCLNLSGATITAIGIKELSTYLTANHKIEKLDVSNNDLENLQVHEQSDCKKPLKSVKFNNCNIRDELFYDLLRSLVVFNEVDLFELERNHIGNKGINQFCSLLATQNHNRLDTTIASLNLSNNDLDSSSAEDVIEIVKICNIKVLNISHNCLDNCLGNNHSVFTYFEDLNVSTIEELDISSNNKHKDNAVQFVENIRCLSVCKGLRILNISNNQLIEAAMDQIYCCFLKCINETNLVEIKCICNENPAKASIESAFNLVRNLYSSDGHVEVINLRGCPEAVHGLISVMANEHLEVSEKIATAIDFHASKVKRIDFAKSNLKPNNNFACVLRKLTSLEELDLSMNKITNKTFIHLVTGFLFTRQLKLGNLHIKDNPCTNDKENYLLLEMINHIRSVNDSFKCLPTNFNAFLFILEHLSSINTENCDVHCKIVHFKSLDLSSLTASNLENEGISRLPKQQAKLSSANVKKFCGYLNYFQFLEDIDLRCNNIKEDDNTKECLAIFVLKNSSIVSIHLEENPIYKKGRIVTLFETLVNVRKSRDQFNFKDHPEMLQAFVDLLQYINDFEDQSCDIVDNIEYLYIKDFYQPKKHRQLYSIEKAKMIVAGFIRHLNLFKKLRTLDLCSTHLTVDVIHELPKFLCSNNTLERLDISENAIKAAGAICILQALQCVVIVNRPCLSIKMTDNDISGEIECENIFKLMCNLPDKVYVDVVKGNKFNAQFAKLIHNLRK